MGGRGIPLTRFEVTVAPDGDVMLSYAGAVRLPDTADARVDGADLVVERDPHPPLRFTGLRSPDMLALTRASRIYLVRTHAAGEEVSVASLR